VEWLTLTAIPTTRPGEASTRCIALNFAVERRGEIETRMLLGGKAQRMILLIDNYGSLPSTCINKAIRGLALR